MHERILFFYNIVHGEQVLLEGSPAVGREGGNTHVV